MNKPKIMLKTMENTTLLPEETIASKILHIRGEKVILDFYLAGFYGIETRTLKQAVRRNIERFPEDFMFELSEEEVNQLVSHFVIPSKSYLGGSVPYAFTETGVAMLSSVIKSKKAIEINITIMRTFILLRKILSNFQDIQAWKEEFETMLSDQNDKILIIFDYIKQFEASKQQIIQQTDRPRIGYKPSTVHNKS